MLFNKTRFATLMFALMLLPIAALADKTSDAKKAIQALYNKEVAALKKKDVKGILASNAPDFVYYSKNGQKADVKTIQNAMTQVMSMASNIKATMKIVKFTLNGNQAVAVTEGHAEITLTNPQNKQPVKLVSKDSSEDTWAIVKGKWMRKQTKVLKENTTMNGQPVPGS